MAFDKLLEQLVEATYGARGAVFLDHDGEVVERYLAHKAIVELDLMGAYHGIALANGSKFAREFEMGNVEFMICQYKEAICLIKTLHAGYFVLLALDPQANIGQAMFLLQDVAFKLNKEMGI
jgi:predicted regulator of Ras-like GTPase activity (Roadblock/LC7/MglB family)